jgi:light-regulated signal transduction histidine kinase (bacteriophytochrome)
LFIPLACQWIILSFREGQSYYVFSAYDDGVGIDGQSTEKILETFHRSEKSGGVAGADLGLAIVKEVGVRHARRACVETSRST